MGLLFGGVRALLLVLLPLLGAAAFRLGSCAANDDCESNLCLGGKCCTKDKGGLSEGCMRCGSNGGCVRCEDEYDLPGFVCVKSTRGHDEDDEGASAHKKKKKKRKKKAKKKKKTKSPTSPAPLKEPVAPSVGPCGHDDDCASLRCLGGKCCTEKGGLSTGCVKCGSNGGCVKCEPGYALPGFVCAKEASRKATLEVGQCEHGKNCATGLCLGGHCCTAKGGMSAGCKKCGSDGGCLRCKKGFSLPGDTCVPRPKREKLSTGTCTLDAHCVSEICLAGHCCAGKGLSPGCGGCQSNGDCATCVDGFELQDGQCVEQKPRMLVGPCVKDQDCDSNICKGSFCCTNYKCTDPNCQHASHHGECARCRQGFRLDETMMACVKVPLSVPQAQRYSTDQRAARPAPEYVDIFMPNYQGLTVEHTDETKPYQARSESSTTE